MLRDAIERLEHRGITVYVSGVPAALENALAAVGALDRLRTAGRVFPGTPEAINAARAHLRHAGVLPTTERTVLDPAGLS